MEARKTPWKLSILPSHRGDVLRPRSTLIRDSYSCAIIMIPGNVANWVVGTNSEPAFDHTSGQPDGSFAYLDASSMVGEFTKFGVWR